MSKPTESDYAELDRALNERGYIVIGSDAVHEIGKRLTHWHHGAVQGEPIWLDHPPIVTAITNRQDLIDQVKLWGRTARPSWDHYYRCITD